jgi:hypothetical protein
MQINEIIPATLLIRRVMQKHGKRAFTNKYDTCRTVKCYAPRTHMEEVELAGDIRSVLARAGYTSFRITKTKGTKWGDPGLIVRVPL